MKRKKVDILILRTYSCSKDPRVSRLVWRLKELGVSVGVICVSNNCIGISPLLLDSHLTVRQPKPLKYSGKFSWTLFELEQTIRLLLKSLTNKPRYAYWGCDLDGFFPTYLASKLTNKKNIYDLFDSWATISGRGISKLIRKIESYMLNLADISVSINVDYLVDSGLKNKDLGFAIDNAVPAKLFSTLRKDQKKQGTTQIEQLMYSGRVDELRAVELAVRVVGNMPDWQFLIQGPGVNLSEKIKDFPNVIQLGSLTYFEALENVSAASIMLATYDPNFPHFKNIDPNKLWEALIFNIPLITSEGCGLEDLVRRENLGYVVKFGDFNELKNALIDFQNQERQQEFALSISEYFNKFSREKENNDNLSNIISFLKKDKSS